MSELAAANIIQDEYLWVVFINLNRNYVDQTYSQQQNIWNYSTQIFI